MDFADSHGVVSESATFNESITGEGESSHHCSWRIRSSDDAGFNRVDVSCGELAAVHLPEFNIAPYPANGAADGGGSLDRR